MVEFVTVIVPWLADAAADDPLTSKLLVMAEPMIVIEASNLRGRRSPNSAVVVGDGGVGDRHRAIVVDTAARAQVAELP